MSKRAGGRRTDPVSGPPVSYVYVYAFFKHSVSIILRLREAVN